MNLLRTDARAHGRPTRTARTGAARFVFAALGATVIVATVSWPGAVRAQNPLASVRELYSSAKYEEAVAVLDTLRASTTGKPLQDVRQIEQYRFLCLLALGREAEASDAMSAVIAADPLYIPEEGDVSPRIRAMFVSLRQQLLPQLATDSYAAAKGAFDAKQFPGAEVGFRRTLALLDEPELAGRMTDLRTLAQGFLDLSVAATAPAAPPPAPVEAAAPAPKPAADPNRVYVAGEAGVIPPVTIRQALPPLPREAVQVGRMLRKGQLELIINESGEVEQVAWRQKVHQAYDPLVLEAARQWRYTPARLNGAPVRYRKVIEVEPRVDVR
jgi:hypothetical protein